MATKETNPVQQQVQFQRAGSVREAMLQAGSQGKSRAIAGIAQALRQKKTSIFGDESTKVSAALRLLGAGKSAEWYERFFAKEKVSDRMNREESRPGQEKEHFKKVLFVEWERAKKKGKETRSWQEFYRDATKGTKPDKSTGGTASPARSGVSSSGTLRAMNSRLIGIHALQSVMAEDVSDIKSLLLVSSKSTTSKPLETAQLAVKIIEKDQAKAELRKKYGYKDKSEKYKQEDPLEKINERLAAIEDKLGEKQKKGLFSMISMLLGGLFSKIKDWFLGTSIGKMIMTIAGWVGKFSGWMTRIVWGAIKGIGTIIRGVWTAVKGIGTIVRGMWYAIRALGTGMAKLLSKWFPGFAVPGLVTVVGAAAAAAVVAGEAYVLDKSMKQTADKNIDKITSDVTANQERNGFKAEDSYAAYKMAIDKALLQPMNKSQERQDYIKQQLTSSEGLSDLERRMAARYYAEKEGGKSKGPTSRGGARNAPVTSTVPPEVVDTDTVDTNYANAPIEEVVVTAAPPPIPAAPAGTLGVKPAAAPAGMSKDQWDIYRETLAAIESGGRYDAVGGAGNHYDGRYQMGKAAKSDAARILGIPDPGHTPEARAAFRANPELQEKMFAAYTAANFGYLKGNSQFKSLSKTKQIEVLGYAHNQGHGGAKEWMRTGNVGSDAFGTKGTKYSEALASNLRSADTPMMADNVAPVRGLGGNMVDQSSRSLQSSTQGGGPVTIVGGSTVNQTTVSQTVPKRKMDRADVLTNDGGLVRTVMRDSKHPVLVG